MKPFLTPRSDHLFSLRAASLVTAPGLFVRVVALFTFAVAWLSMPLVAQSSDGAIEGRVLNAASGDYLNNVRISVPGSNRVTFSDPTGAYSLLNVPAGSVTLRISYTGSPDQDIVVQVMPGKTVRRDINLDQGSSRSTGRETIELDSFKVSASREMDAQSLAINEQRYAGNIKNVIAADAFGDVSEGNVGEFIKRLAGVTINEAAGDAYSISLRGFSPEFTPITVDGNSIPSASFSATSVSRGSNLEQISMSNVSRIEVIKSPIPSISADSLGGTVNLKSKSAFERSRPQLIVRGTLQFTADDYDLKKTPGPGSPKTSKLRPGYEFSYVNPVSKTFGFTLSSLLSDQFGKLLGPIRTFEFAPAQGGSIAAPYLRGFRTTDDARETRRESYAASADWKPVEALTLSFGVRHTIYDLFTAPQRLNFNTGNNPVSSGPDYTQGRTGAASIVHQQIWTTKYGNTDQFTLAGKYRQGAWKGDFSGSYAKSGNKYRDVDRGFFRGATTRLVSPTLRWEGFEGTNMPNSVEVRNAAGNVVDWTRLNNYQMVNVLSVQRDATDEIASGMLDLRRELTLVGNPGAIQVGASYRKRQVDRDARDQTRNFVGADGVALTSDDMAGPYVDASYNGVDQKFGVPQQIQWPDLRALYQLYQDHPNYFTQTLAQQTSSYTFEVTNSERISEEISAAYIQGELSLMDGNLMFLGGVRLERTKNVGVGLLRDRNAAYQHDAAGNIIRTANGTPVLVTTNTLERAKLEYQRRGLTASRSYSDYYPSVNATYRITPDLLLRASYARTLGRPNFANVVPNLDIVEDLSGDGTTGQIVGRNPALKPWEADNYEASLEYYFRSSGVVSVGVFRKNVTNGFGTETTILDRELLTQFELDPMYLGWDLRTTFNIGELVKINGVEFNYQQQLKFLPSWARGVSVFGNATLLDIDGPDSAFGNLVRRTANWGLSYSRGRIGFGLNWNYRSSDTSALTLGGVAGSNYTASRLTLDVNSEFRITPRLSLFFNARNLTNELDLQDRYTDQTPEYSRAYLRTDRGVKMSIGVRGKF